MARTIRCSFAILILINMWSTFAHAQAKPKTAEQEVIIVLPSDVKLSPGRSYQGEIVISGKKITAQVKVPGGESTQKPNDKPEEASKSSERENSPSTTAPNVPKESSDKSTPSHIPPTQPDWVGIALAALVPVILIALGALVYLEIFRPRKQLQPYREALNQLYQKKYEEALRLLTQVESKLPDELRREARFFVAFANFQLKNTKEAEYILNALYREDPNDQNTAYLLAYLRVEDKRYDEAEPILERMDANGQLNLHHARKLLGIVKFHRALVALRDGRVDAAGELFEKVQALGDFTGQIPTDLRNRQIVLGTKALFEKDLPEARKQFESLQSAAAKSTKENGDALLATAKIGLALVKWLEDAPNGYSSIEELLVEAAKLLGHQGSTEIAWQTDAGKNVVEKLKDLDEETKQSPEKKETDHFLRDIHFLRGMAVLRAWGRMECEAAHKAINAQYESSLARFACARALDDEFGDVYLVVGLLMYYLHKPGPERSKGVDLLQQAQKRGMRDPDAMEIINNRERIERANASVIDKYLQVLDKYLTDDTIRKEVRLALMERLGKYRKIQSWEKRPDLARARSVEPTVAEMRNRSEILLTRVEQIISSRGNSDELVKLKNLSAVIVQDSQKLYEQAQTIEKEEAELLAETASQLFRD